MSISIETIVCCDGCDENNGGDDRYMSAKDIRAERKLYGWTQIGKKDYCPSCSEKMKRGRA